MANTKRTRRQMPGRAPTTAPNAPPPREGAPVLAAEAHVGNCHVTLLGDVFDQLNDAQMFIGEAESIVELIAYNNLCDDEAIGKALTGALHLLAMAYANVGAAFPRMGGTA